MHCPAFLENNNIWVSLIVGGLANGFLYALIALGYTLVYGVLRLINFAHSEVVMAGGFGGLFVMRARARNEKSRPATSAIWFMIVGVVAGASRAVPPLSSWNGSRTGRCESERTQADISHQRHRSFLFPFNIAGKEFGRYTAFIPDAERRPRQPLLPLRRRCSVGLGPDHGLCNGPAVRARPRRQPDKARQGHTGRSPGRRDGQPDGREHRQDDRTHVRARRD